MVVLLVLGGGLGWEVSVFSFCLTVCLSVSLSVCLAALDVCVRFVVVVLFYSFVFCL